MIKFTNCEVCNIVWFVQANLVAQEYWKLLEESKTLPLNGIDCCKNTFGSLRQSFFIFFSIFSIRNTIPFLQLFTGINSVTHFFSFHRLSNEGVNCRGKSFSYFGEKFTLITFNYPDNTFTHIRRFFNKVFQIPVTYTPFITPFLSISIIKEKKTLCFCAKLGVQILHHQLQYQYINLFFLYKKTYRFERKIQVLKLLKGKFRHMRQ